ncbi:aspartate carbamoyltransferase [Candidatus Curtissbacteria bacterium RIFCSPHIGHO2_12_FULL_42_33]|nr:MAG: aspartate carbamoyltransferase [Candidatus Curtissbacteria bacterium RIFCSPHIGHO2_12_FULL_42_33]
MKLRHIISARQFDKKTLEQIFNLTDKIKSQKYNNNHLSGKIMATLFYEPSTRTRLSFESAMLRLGGKVITTESAAEFSSAAKGETLEDTIRVVNSYCDVIVIRHFNEGASEVASRYSKVPVINAGDGKGEHPTQAILDLYTIFSRFNRADFTIAMVGDLKNGRTIHSLCPLLAHYPKVKIIFISPKALAAPKSLKEYLKQRRVHFEETENFKKVELADVIYQTRIQKERFKNTRDYQKYFGKYIIDGSILKYLRSKAVIMHPLPRVNEITQEVDSDRRAIYFEEAANGLYTRMAILAYLFDKS